MKRPRDPYIATWKMLSKPERLALAKKTLKLKKFLVWPTVVFCIPMYLNIQIFLPVYLFFVLFSFLNRYSAVLSSVHPENFVEYNKYLDSIDESSKVWDEYWKEHGKNSVDNERIDFGSCSSESIITDSKYRHLSGNIYHF